MVISVLFTFAYKEREFQTSLKKDFKTDCSFHLLPVKIKAGY
jgi:hypothetical protein